MSGLTVMCTELQDFHKHKEAGAQGRDQTLAAIYCPQTDCQSQGSPGTNQTCLWEDEATSFRLCCNDLYALLTITL